MNADDPRQQHLIGVVQTIAMQAMELPPDHRARFVERAVKAIRMDFDQKYGADPATEEAADHLQRLVLAVVKIIEETGGSVGNA